MNKTDLAIIQIVANMNEAQQEQALSMLQAFVNTPKPTLGEWLDSLEAQRKINEVAYGTPKLSSVDLLHESYEEQMNDLLGGS